jgi:transposase
LTEREFTKILDWPGYRVYRHEIDEKTRALKLWVRRKSGNRVLTCSGCGGRCRKIAEIRQREVRDLPWRKYQTTVVVEFYRVYCPRCGLKVEKVPQLPSKAPFSKDFEDALGLRCESAAARQVARQFGIAAGTARAIDQRYLERWAKKRRKPVLRQMGVDEIYLGKATRTAPLNWPRAESAVIKAPISALGSAEAEPTVQKTRPRAASHRRTGTESLIS